MSNQHPGNVSEHLILQSMIPLPAVSHQRQLGGTLQLDQELHQSTQVCGRRSQEVCIPTYTDQVRPLHHARLSLGAASEGSGARAIFDALWEKHLDLVPEGIQECDETGVVSESGRKDDIDIVAMAMGVPRHGFPGADGHGRRGRETTCTSSGWIHAARRHTMAAT